MDFRIAKIIHEYCAKHSSVPEQFLLDLERETHLKTLSPYMISGALLGNFLKMVSNMIRPEKVLEVGTFTGYSALCLASGLSITGKLWTVEQNIELKSIILKYIRRSNNEQKIIPIFGKFEEIADEIPGEIDLAFLDAGKREYDLHYEILLKKLRSGGWLLIDNVLWSGKVVYPEMDKDTLLIRQFNQKVADDVRVEKLLLPVRDGIFMVQKK
jgi:caffeoyl-CoA O-methyltransferase